MGLRDVTGVFSRFFVVGFYVPTFFVVLAISALFVDVDRAAEIYLVGGAALPIALALVGIRRLVWRAIEQYPPGWRFVRSTDEYHTRIQDRWTIDVYKAWPFIEPLLGERERELDVDGRSDVHFFLNSCLGALVVAVAVGIDALRSPVRDQWGWNAALGVLALAVAGLSYLAAARVVKDWGDFKEAAVVHHRSTLYERFGLLQPGRNDEERGLARKLNELLRDTSKPAGRSPRPNREGGGARPA